MMQIQEVLDNTGQITKVLCSNEWSYDMDGKPVVCWWITFPCGDTCKMPLPVFTEFWS